MSQAKDPKRLPFHIDPAVGLKGLVRYFFSHLRISPVKTIFRLPSYVRTLKAAWTRRKTNLLKGYLSVGLPDENGLFDTYRSDEINYVKKALRRQDIRDFDEPNRLTHRAKDLSARAVSPTIEYTRRTRRPIVGDYKLLYLAHESIIKKSNGYTIRTHALLKALVNHGVGVQVLVRPQATPSYAQTLNGVKYTHFGIEEAQWDDWNTYESIFKDQIKQIALSFQPDFIQAASNHITGRSAQLAAQELDLPFFYEVRGFWHITRQSTLPKYAKTTAWQAQENAEATIVRDADHVFTLNHLLKSRAIEMGASPSRMSILGNCGTLPSSRRGKRESSRRFRIGYVGSVVAYEGLDIVIDALSHTSADELKKIECHIYGSGDYIDTLKKRALKTPALPIFFHGAFKNSGEALRQIYDSVDLVVLPRKSSPVTELVTPLKPFEAASYECPMLVSDVAPLVEFSENSGAALTFKSDDPEDLAMKLKTLLLDPDLRSKLSESGQKYIREHANWDMAAKHMISIYDGFSE